MAVPKIKKSKERFYTALLRKLQIGGRDLKKSTSLTKAIFNRIESEIHNYHQTLKEIRELEDYEKNRTSVGQGSVITIFKKYAHLTEVISAIDAAVSEISKDQRQLIKQIYWNGPLKNIDKASKEDQEFRSNLTLKIAIILGWS